MARTGQDEFTAIHRPAALRRRGARGGGDPGVPARRAVRQRGAARCARRRGCNLARVAGVDEAGRGPLAGPVVAAAVILDPRRRIRGLADSKALSARASASAWRPSSAPARSPGRRLGRPRRDRLPEHLPGDHAGDAPRAAGAAGAPDARARRRQPLPAHRRPAAAAARSRRSSRAMRASRPSAPPRSSPRPTAMRSWSPSMPAIPGFALGVHKGYGTPAHLSALRVRAPSPLHRRSFGPVRCQTEAD